MEKSQVYEDPVEYPDTSDAENESILWTSEDEEDESSDDDGTDNDTFSVYSDDEVKTKTFTLDTRLTPRRIAARADNENFVSAQQGTNHGFKTRYLNRCIAIQPAKICLKPLPVAPKS